MNLEKPSLSLPTSNKLLELQFNGDVNQLLDGGKCICGDYSQLVVIAATGDGKNEWGLLEQ